MFFQFLGERLEKKSGHADSQRFIRCLFSELHENLKFELGEYLRTSPMTLFCSAVVRVLRHSEATKNAHRTHLFAARDMRERHYFNSRAKKDFRLYLFSILNCVIQ